jgi:PST family polysaccharide transporter
LIRRNYFRDDGPIADLHKRSLQGGAVTILAAACAILLQAISTIVLARILVPEDFGLVAMVSAVTGFASVFVDLGTRDAVAQRGKVSEGEVSALHWITVGVGAAFCAIVVISAPVFVSFFKEPRLEQIAFVLSSTLLLPALYCQQQALMRRALMFKALAVIDIVANVISTVVAIALASAGFGYWSLVWKPVVTFSVTTLGVWIACGWWPGRPTFTSNVRELLGFGLNVTGFTVADYVARSMDRVALGSTVGARQLGYYQNAFTVYDNAVTVTNPLHNVATATLSKLRSEPGELKRAWSSALSSLVYFTAPAFATLAVVGQDLVVLLLGEKWLTAGAILAILALRGPMQVVERTVGWLHIAAGRPDRWRRWGFAYCGATLVALFCGLPFGTMGVATAYVVMMLVLFIPAVAYAGKPLGLNIQDVVRTVGPQIAVALGVAAIGFLGRGLFLEGMDRLPRLVVMGIFCPAAYLAVMVFCFRMTKPLSHAVSLIRRRRGQT